MIATVTLSLVLAASAAPVDSGQQVHAQEETKPDKPKKICKTIAVTGSRLGRRECKTQEQWTQAESALELTVKGGKGAAGCSQCIGTGTPDR